MPPAPIGPNPAGGGGGAVGGMPGGIIPAALKAAAIAAIPGGMVMPPGICRPAKPGMAMPGTLGGTGTGIAELVAIDLLAIIFRAAAFCKISEDVRIA